MHLMFVCRMPAPYRNLNSVLEAMQGLPPSAFWPLEMLLYPFVCRADAVNVLVYIRLGSVGMNNVSAFELDNIPQHKCIEVLGIIDKV
jgi:hypothetical protein